MFPVSGAEQGGPWASLQHPSPVCYPDCCRVSQSCLTFNDDISVTSSCSTFPALEQEGWWSRPGVPYSSLYSSASIYWQERVKSHISRVQGSPAAGFLPAEVNKHPMNELPESVSLQWKNKGLCCSLKALFPNESSSVAGNLTETRRFA